MYLAVAKKSQRIYEKQSITFSYEKCYFKKPPGSNNSWLCECIMLVPANKYVSIAMAHRTWVFVSVGFAWGWDLFDFSLVAVKCALLSFLFANRFSIYHFRLLKFFLFFPNVSNSYFLQNILLSRFVKLQGEQYPFSFA